ncbi:hydroxymethylbilane synthase [soil metagenome]
MESELVPMVTSGDRGVPASSTHRTGLKGLFVLEIERALAAGEIHLAVHSAKDLPSEDPEGIQVAAVIERADPFDVLVTREAGVPAGSVIGTSSLRRQAQLRRSRPELVIRDMRGNVDTRLAKLERGEVDGLVLAAAGLARLGLAPAFSTPLPLEEMVPAPGQGALAVQARSAGDAMEAARQLDHAPSRVAFEAERRLVRLVGGGCALPLGAYAERRGDAVRLLAVVIRPDGGELARGQAEAPEADEVAREVAALLLARGAGPILAAAREGA